MGAEQEIILDRVASRIIDFEEQPASEWWRRWTLTTDKTMKDVYRRCFEIQEFREKLNKL